MTKFGEMWKSDLRSLALEASIAAINDAQIDPKDIDAIYFANMLGSRFANQDHLGALIASELGLTVPSIHIEAACASGGAAIRLAFLELMSKTAKNILVVGAEKMNDADVNEITSGLAGASDEEWEASLGVTFPSLYAMIAREHMYRFGTSREQLSMIAVKNHKHASMNKLAQFPKELSLSDAVNSSPVADPLNLMDCSPITDGACAIVLSTEKKNGIRILASSQAQDTLALHDRKDIVTLQATVDAADKAFKASGIERDDIGLIELHDCFTIAEILAYEDLGFAKKGDGGKLIEEGKTYYNAELPVNTSGGLKACGHPVGATGIKQAYEIYLQMMGQAGERQVKRNLKYALSHNVGGSGATAVVTIYENLK